MVGGISNSMQSQETLQGLQSQEVKTSQTEELTKAEEEQQDAQLEELLKKFSELTGVGGNMDIEG